MATSEHVVITGANRGLGLALAHTYAERGAVVIAGCRYPDAADTLHDITPHVIELDVADAASIAAFAIEAVEVADERVDVLVNNAGIDARNLGATNDERGVLVQRPEHIVGQFEVNALGPLLMTRALQGSLRAAERGRVLNMSSQLGSLERGAEMGNDVGYAASKAALNMITIELATALADDGTTVVAMHPGHVATSMGGAAAPMTATESAMQIANVANSLTIDDSGSFRRWDGSLHPW